MKNDISEMLAENDRRNAAWHTPFNPVTGEGSTGERTPLRLSDCALPLQLIPKEMEGVELVKGLAKAGSIGRYLEALGEQDTEEARAAVVAQLTRTRCRHDFPFWAFLYVIIKRKGGSDIHFRLNHPQRKLVEWLERKRLAGLPIRLVLLKARQWGGSTCIQMYMAWLQFMHRRGLNSLIVGHVSAASDEVKDMFRKMIAAYPLEMLHEAGEKYAEGEAKMVGVGNSGNINRIPQRNFKIKVGTAIAPETCRGGDYSLVHCTEVGLWKRTEGKAPEDIIQSATSGILLRPYTMIVYESTAKGAGNFFHREYVAAKDGKSQFGAMFVAWHEIENYRTDKMRPDEAEAFATWLHERRGQDTADSERTEAGKYFWWLWERQGATLEAIKWYVEERRKFNDHAQMASEYPSDDVEAFTFSGQRVFDKYAIEALKGSCRAPLWVGEVYAAHDTGKEAVKGVRFKEDAQGGLWVWAKPEVSDRMRVAHRYLVVVDIGGRSKGADWSVVCVFDRFGQMGGGKPSVAAQWYGHIDMDLLAWKAAQIATWYDNALLVIESNTLETKDRDRIVDGDQAAFILNQVKGAYDNLYARKQSEEDIQAKVPVKYGFHTNVSTKPMIISTLVKVIREGLYTERDGRCLVEYECYERKPNGSFGAIAGQHDDLLMTRAIGLHIAYFEMPQPKLIDLQRLKADKERQRRRIVSEATIG